MKKINHGPSLEDQPSLTDSYFNLTRRVVNSFGDTKVTYAIFMRRPITLAPKLAIKWLKNIIDLRGGDVEINQLHKEGAWVGAGEPLFYIRSRMSNIVDLETIFLQKLGAPCVAAYNAYQMCIELPQVSFLAMDARHCAGSEMAELMAYGASVGSRKAKTRTYRMAQYHRLE